MRPRSIWTFFFAASLGVVLAGGLTGLRTAQARKPISARADYQRAIDRVSRLSRFHFSETFHFLQAESGYGYVDLRFAAPNRLRVRLGLHGAAASVQVRVVTRSQLRTILSNWLVVERAWTVPFTGDNVLHHVQFGQRAMGSGGGRGPRELITIRGRGYPWGCDGQRAGCEMTGTLVERQNRYVGALTVDKTSGLPLAFSSTDYRLGVPRPGQQATFVYGR